MTSTERGLWCVVPAAGRGARFGGDVPKQYQMLAGKPMLLQTIERLVAHARIAGIMVALAADDRYWHESIAVGAKTILTTIGGNERADSVLAGLHALREKIGDNELVLVHDAARPCVSAEDISRLIVLGTPSGGALLAAPMRDTLKRSDHDRRVEATEPRDARWRALTPQMFRFGELVAALRSALDAGITITDEAMAMERAGHRPLLVEGSESNIKITTPDDLALAEFILARQTS
ncbi:MAG TPA: 2-C-methyl-D-erythritol 4-phosphate cytidylyltransferase [Rudaea sp.]